MGYKLKRILIYPDGVTEKQVYPAGWKPNANTLAYYPLEKDGNDYSGNNLNGTWRSTPTYSETYSGGTKKAALFSSNWLALNLTGLGAISEWSVNVWVKLTTRSGKPEIFDCSATSGNRATIYWGYDWDDGPNSWGFAYKKTSSGSYIRPGVSNIDVSKWHNLCVTLNSSGMNLYTDGVLSTTLSGDCSILAGYLLNAGIGARRSGTTNFFNGYISEFILENKLWTVDEALNYYNTTKSNYGL